MQKILDREVLQQELLKRYEDAKLVWGEHADKQHRIGRGASRDGTRYSYNMVAFRKKD